MRETRSLGHNLVLVNLAVFYRSLLCVCSFPKCLKPSLWWSVLESWSRTTLVSLQISGPTAVFWIMWRPSFYPVSALPHSLAGLHLELLGALWESLHPTSGFLFPSISGSSEFSCLCSFSLAFLSWEVRRKNRCLGGLSIPRLCSPERNRLYDSTLCSKLSFKAHLGVLRNFSTCQLIRDVPLQMSCFPTVHGAI